MALPEWCGWVGELLGETGPQKRGSHEHIKVCERPGDKPGEGGPSGTSSAGGCAPEDPDEDKMAAKARKG
jgi:hypothetical protein